jgi:hypothetical protein
LQLGVGPLCQSPKKDRTRQGHPVAVHQAPASIRCRIKSDDGYLALDPNLKIANSTLIDAYPHWETALSNIGKLRVRERAKDRDWQCYFHVCFLIKALISERPTRSIQALCSSVKIKSGSALIFTSDI